MDFVAFRRALHAAPELSGEEAATAARIVEALPAPDALLTGLGGHGVAAVYAGAAPGPTLMFRAELDGLPIQEISDFAHRSRTPGKGHLCGHDGHMAALLALAFDLARDRPKRGRAVLLFQPAEETGAGAAAVLSDPRFAQIAPDFAFAWHNMPGLPLGQAALKAGPANCASRGLALTLTGRTAHASAPETGVSPMRALARLMPALTALGGEAFRLATITHARLGEPAFGVAPGEAELFATLRTLTDDGMGALVDAAEALIGEVARAEGLRAQIAYRDVFAHCENAPEATERLARALAAEGIRVGEAGLPMRASEDFGRFRAACPSAMFLLGAGERAPALHNPDYDFPDALIPIAAGVMARAAREALG
jgi:amidohydrolase